MLILSAVLCAACSEPDAADSVPAPGTARVTLRREGTAEVAAYAFRRRGDRFLFDTLFREGWSPEGTLSVRMPNGQYKFLFAGGAGRRLVPEPDPIDRQTAWEEVAFALRENAEVPGTCLPADELFLQYPASDADAVYTVGGRDLTVPATLRRAVCRIEVSVRRGYRDGRQYVEVPYEKPHSVLDEVERIELSAGNTGLRVNPSGSGGTAVVTAVLAAADYAELTDGGFVRLEGPFVIPPADGGEVTLDLSVVPAEGAALQPVQLHRLQGVRSATSVSTLHSGSPRGIPSWGSKYEPPRSSGSRREIRVFGNKKRS